MTKMELNNSKNWRIKR